MSIHNNINGINKEVNNTKVNIDGTWREIKQSSNNVDGQYKEINTVIQYYSVRIYDNSTLLTTYTCKAGDSIVLPLYSNKKGYSKYSGGTTVHYNIGESIIPTDDMDLYLVSKSTYYVYIYHNGSLYTTLTCLEGGSVTLPNISGIKGYSTVNNATSASYNAGSYYTPNGTISLYSVVQKYNVIIYHNKAIFRSESVTAGSSYTLPSNISNLYGYAISSSSTTSSYSPGQTISVNGELILYTLIQSGNQKTLYSSNSLPTSVTIPIDQMVTFYVSVSASSEGLKKPLQTNGSAPYIKIGSQYIGNSSSTFSQSVKSGVYIEICGYNNSGVGYGATTSISMNYTDSSIIVNTCA